MSVVMASDAKPSTSLTTRPDCYVTTFLAKTCAEIGFDISNRFGYSISMTRFLSFLCVLMLMAFSPLGVGAQAPAKAKPPVYPSPTEIVAAAPAADWADIAVNDLLVMDLSADARGNLRRVLIQLLPAPFSQGWVGNIRELAEAHWWDGNSINRAQDNYVVQWGDPNSDDPKLAKKLPEGLVAVPYEEYATDFLPIIRAQIKKLLRNPKLIEPIPTAGSELKPCHAGRRCGSITVTASKSPIEPLQSDGGERTNVVGSFHAGMPFGSTISVRKSVTHMPTWPTHCYGMVGVGRNLPPDTGTGAELYVVIGQAPRQLDRNIALVGRVVEGMENLSTLPRGHGPLGFYDLSKGDERVPIRSVRLASDLPAADQPHLQYLSTESASFAKYVDARANRRDPFYIQPAGGVDICNVPVPVRRRP